MKHTLLAGVLAGLLASPAFAAVDAVYDMDWDVSGETTHNNVTVEKDVTLTNDNKYCVGGVCMDVTSKYVVQGTLTNNGTIVGKGGALLLTASCDDKARLPKGSGPFAFFGGADPRNANGAALLGDPVPITCCGTI